MFSDFRIGDPDTEDPRDTIPSVIGSGWSHPPVEPGVWTVTIPDCLGIGWMRADTFYSYSASQISVWNMNRFYVTFAEVGARVTHLKRVESGGGALPSRVLVVTEDRAIKILSPVTGLTLFTAFPNMEDTTVTDLEHDIPSATVWMLSTAGRVSVYTTKTNPAIIVDVWDTEVGCEKLSSICALRKTIESPTGDTFDQVLCLIGGTEAGQIVLLNINVIKGRQELIVQAHSCCVEKITCHPERMLVLSLGSDGTLKIWKMTIHGDPKETALAGAKPSYPLALELAFTLNVRGSVGVAAGFALNAAASILAVYTRSNAVLMYKLSDTGLAELPHHPSDEDHVRSVTCVVALETMNVFATSGTDGVVKIWDGYQNLLLKEVQFGTLVQSICFCNKRGDLLVGLPDQVALLKMQDYFPPYLLQEIVNKPIVDDLNEIPMTFDDTLDFWQVYRDMLVSDGKDLSFWHLAERPHPPASDEAETLERIEKMEREIVTRAIVSKDADRVKSSAKESVVPQDPSADEPPTDGSKTPKDLPERAHSESGSEISSSGSEGEKIDAVEQPEPLAAAGVMHLQDQSLESKTEVASTPAEDDQMKESEIPVISGERRNTNAFAEFRERQLRLQAQRVREESEKIDRFERRLGRGEREIEARRTSNAPTVAVANNRELHGLPAKKPQKQTQAGVRFVASETSGSGKATQTGLGPSVAGGSSSRSGTNAKEAREPGSSESSKSKSARGEQHSAQDSPIARSGIDGAGQGNSSGAASSETRDGAAGAGVKRSIAARTGTNVAAPLPGPIKKFVNVRRLARGGGVALPNSVAAAEPTAGGTTADPDIQWSEAYVAGRAGSTDSAPQSGPRFALPEHLRSRRKPVAPPAPPANISQEDKYAVSATILEDAASEPEEETTKATIRQPQQPLAAALPQEETEPPIAAIESAQQQKDQPENPPHEVANCQAPRAEIGSEATEATAPENETDVRQVEEPRDSAVKTSAGDTQVASPTTAELAAAAAVPERRAAMREESDIFSLLPKRTKVAGAGMNETTTAETAEASRAKPKPQKRFLPPAVPPKRVTANIEPRRPSDLPGGANVSRRMTRKTVQLPAVSSAQHAAEAVDFQMEKEQAEMAREAWTLLETVQQTAADNAGEPDASAAVGSDSVRAGGEKPQNMTSKSQEFLTASKVQLLEAVSARNWFPGLAGKEANVTNILEVTMRVMRNAEWRDKMEASKAMLYLFHTFESDLVDPVQKIVIPQLDYLRDERWQVRAQIAANLSAYRVRHPEILTALISTLGDENDVVRKAVKSTLATFGVSSKESLKNAMAELGMLPPVVKVVGEDWLDVLRQRLEARMRG
ncbi:WD repeat-containing protein 87 [Entophlyctis luteolus]|nr:WD repeat-containing protein 87 [Entophlyctis luteolus]